MSDAEEGAGAAPSPAKEDPETLVLRGRPRRVIRFRKGLIIGVTGAVSAALITLTWVSLKPATFRLVADQESTEPAAKATPDAIAGAPAAYSDVPKLGPPLPGDLGRAILDHQRQLGAEGQGASSGPGRNPQAERAAAERQRLASEEQAARASAVLVQLSKAAPATAAAPAEVPAASAAVQPASEPAAAAASLGSQQRKLDFVRSEDGDTNTHALVGPASPWTLRAGAVIPASLVTGLNSDLPGMVVAQVTENVRDSATGRAILIPQGARLIGAYDSVVAFGQQRALLVWQRIIFPDGSSVRLDNMPATDAAGYAGLEDKVDFHEWRLLKGLILSSLLGVGSELSSGGGQGDIVRALRDSAWQNGARAGDQIVSRNLDVQPTLKVRPGWPVRAIVHKDLVLQPWRG
jgi:type IV secretion system protein VirB10